MQSEERCARKNIYCVEFQCKAKKNIKGEGRYSLVKFENQPSSTEDGWTKEKYSNIIPGSANLFMYL